MTLKFDATNTKLQRSRNTMKCNITNQVYFIHTVMHRLTMGIQSEKCIVRQFHCHANVVVYLHKPRQYILLHNLSIWYSLLLLGYKPVRHVTVLNTVGNCNTVVL